MSPLHLDGHGRPRHVVRQLVDLREGRHPEDQLAKLDQLGCDYAQGHLFARPETASRFGELLGHDRRWQ